ncbi:MAG: hypothetical protein QHH75_09945 [Bacillota bacterium]|nr:hypothetical protein [Bacillota bacterium]
MFDGFGNVRYKRYLRGPTIGCYLEAGHTYAFRFGISGAVSQYGAQYTLTDFWNDGPGARGLDVSHVVVEF